MSTCKKSSCHPAGQGFDKAVFDAEVDARGLRCPEPLMVIRNRMMDMQSGEIVKVTATDPSTSWDIPKFCNFLGHELLHSVDATDGETTSNKASTNASNNAKSNASANASRDSSTNAMSNPSEENHSSVSSENRDKNVASVANEISETSQVSVKSQTKSADSGSQVYVYWIRKG